MKEIFSGKSGCQTMSIKDLQTLSMNPHFYSLVLQSFLSGYGSSCELQKSFLVLPMILYEPIRTKLTTANSRSRMDTLFHTSKYTISNMDIDGRSRFAGFYGRYDLLMPFSKKALIILYSEGSISIENYKIQLHRKIQYQKYEGNVSQWLKSAYYLGMIFSKSTNAQLSHYLGVYFE